jgi:hypothetical protein
MARLIATATCTAFRAVLEDGGHRVGQRLPATVEPDAVLHAPTLRPTPTGRVAVDLPHSKPVLATQAIGHTQSFRDDSPPSPSM